MIVMWNTVNSIMWHLQTTKSPKLGSMWVMDLSIGSNQVQTNTTEHYSTFYIDEYCIVYRTALHCTGVTTQMFHGMDPTRASCLCNEVIWRATFYKRRWGEVMKDLVQWETVSIGDSRWQCHQWIYVYSGRLLRWNALVQFFTGRFSGRWKFIYKLVTWFWIKFKIIILISRLGKLKELREDDLTKR